MKLIRKTLILIIFLVISVTSMVTGVFAWFIETGNTGYVDSFGASMISPAEVIEINAEKDGIFLGDRIRDLMYLSDADFNSNVSDFYGYSSRLDVTIINPNPHPITVQIKLNVMAAPEFGILAGSQAGLKYLTLIEHEILPLSTYLNELMVGFQNGGNMLQKMNNHNTTGFVIPAGEERTAYVYIWGYFDGLTQIQKNNFHALVYRVKIVV